jgi:hypothetical protein
VAALTATSGALPVRLRNGVGIRMRFAMALSRKERGRIAISRRPKTGGREVGNGQSAVGNRNCGIPFADCRWRRTLLPIADCRLPIADCR